MLRLPLNLVAMALWRAKRSSMHAGLSAYAEFETSPPAIQRDLLGRRLLLQLRHFAARPDALPQWREAAKLRNPHEVLELWPTLPIITKETLRSHFSISDIVRWEGSSGQVSSTGGSTGEPTHFYHDATMLASTSAARYIGWRRMGWQPGTPTLVLWGSERDIGRGVPLRSRLSTTLHGFHTIAGYKVGDATVQRCVSLIDRFRPVCVYGFTSILEHVAQSLISHNVTYPVGAVQAAWNGGEMLFQHQSDVFLDVFKVPVLNCYGGRELGLMAHQTHAYGPLHVMRPFLIVEVVDANGAPAPPGQPGRLIWTSTVCRGTPFLRYEIGDLGTYGADDIDESGIRRLHRLEGRVGSVVTLPDGQTVNMLIWNHLFKEFPEVYQFQVRIQRAGSLHILLKGVPPSNDRSAALEATISGIVGATPFSLRWVDAIPLTPQGKLVQVVRETGDSGSPSM